MQIRQLRSRRAAITLLVALALLAVSCGDDGGSSDGNEDTTSSVGAELDAEAPVEPDESLLSASAPGITAETITLGYTSIDFDLLNSTYGLDLAYVGNAPIADAIAAWHNENGGVLGREIELIHESFVPVGPISAEEVCVKLAEDVTVFAVLGGFAGPGGAGDTNECFAELNDKIVVGAAPRADQAERAGGLWVSSDISVDRRNPAAARLMGDAGVLDDLGPMAVIGSSADGAAEEMANALRDEGVDVVFDDWVTTTGDRVATAANVGVWIERARNAGASTVVMLGLDEYRNQEFFIQAPEFTYIMGNGEAITDWESIPPEGLEPGTRVLTNNNGPDVGAFDDPRLVECIEVVEEALGVEVLATSQLPDGDPNYFAGAVGVCRTFSLFIQIAETAGPDLTNESWIAALDNVEDLSIPGYEFVSLSSDKVDTRDQLVLVEFDLETLSFDPITEPTDVG
jgi:hypothetical protein